MERTGSLVLPSRVCHGKRLEDAVCTAIPSNGAEVVGLLVIDLIGEVRGCQRRRHGVRS
jgi:hypothetical protein